MPLVSWRTLLKINKTLTSEGCLEIVSFWKKNSSMKRKFITSLLDMSYAIMNFLKLVHK